jgi:hypothetical protein
MPNSGAMKRPQAYSPRYELCPGGGAKTMRWYLDRYSDPVAREHMAEGLHKAGVPEQ